MTPGDIGAFGERIVTAWLTAKGYQCYRNTQQPGSTDIEARGQPSLLVQVKTGLYPNQPPVLSATERGNITSRATRLGYQAWLAQVQINSQGQQVGEIRWEKLN